MLLDLVRGRSGRAFVGLALPDEARFGPRDRLAPPELLDGPGRPREERLEEAVRAH